MAKYINKHIYEYIYVYIDKIYDGMNPWQKHRDMYKYCTKYHNQNQMAAAKKRTA
jgi:hypothetical protein